MTADQDFLAIPNIDHFFKPRPISDALSRRIRRGQAAEMTATTHDRDTTAASQSSDSDTAMLAALPVDKDAEAAGPNCSQARLPNPMNTQNKPTFARRRSGPVLLVAVALSCLSAGVSLLALCMPESLFMTIHSTKVISATTACTLFAAALMLSAIHITRS